jgi:hypothetical protein
MLEQFVNLAAPVVFALGLCWAMTGGYALMGAGGDQARAEEAVQRIEDGGWCCGLALTAWALGQLVSFLVGGVAG